MLGRFRRRHAQRAAGDDARMDALERRLGRLEEVMEGLQDAVHREAVRRDERDAHLEHKTEPAEIARALSEHARSRGL
jgi:uncharacterized coiled-coil protein SlyX